MNDFDNDTLLEDAIHQAVLDYFFDEETEISDLHGGRLVEAFCQVLGYFAAVDASKPTDGLASELGRIFSYHREYFLKYFNENPLNRLDRFGHRSQ